MMTELQFKNLKNFGWNERTIHGDLIRDALEILDPDFMQRMDFAVSDAKNIYGSIHGQFIIYDVNFLTHSSTGYHPRGRALDGAFHGLNLFESFIIADRWRFGGFGIYPDTMPAKMLHIDDRNFYRSSRWVRFGKDEYIYDSTVFMSELLRDLV